MTEGRRYHGLDVLTRSRITIAPATTEVTPDNGIQHSAPNPEQRITR
jgi:hypothetical protein